MPLRDHFHPPFSSSRSWEEFHGQWPGEMVRHLRSILPPGYQAGPRIRLGSSFEVDIGSLQKEIPDFTNGEGGTGVALAPTPTLVADADLSEHDEYEVRIYDVERDRTLVAAIEIVSPANKDRASAREQFVGKVSALLRQDVCVSIVDLVNERHVNLYAELLPRIASTDPALGTNPPALYAVTLYGRKPVKGPSRLEAWYYPMQVGEPLPTLPIWLSLELRVLLPLETSYQETCRVLDIE